jgi:hypothetical protein
LAVNFASDELNHSTAVIGLTATRHFFKSNQPPFRCRRSIKFFNSKETTNVWSSNKNRPLETKKLVDGQPKGKSATTWAPSNPIASSAVHSLPEASLVL